MTGTPKTDRTPWGDGRVAFRAHSAEILARIALGWPRSRVWREFRDRLGGLSSSQFNRYVQAALADPETAPTTVKPPAPSALDTIDAYRARRAAETANAQQEPESTSLKTFHFDPMDAYRKKYE